MFSHYRLNNERCIKFDVLIVLTVIAIAPPLDRTSKFIENSFQIPILQTLVSHWTNTSLKVQPCKLYNK